MTGKRRMLDENTIRQELKKIKEMCGPEPVNGIQHTLLWVLGYPGLITPSTYIDPDKGRTLNPLPNVRGVVDRTK